MAMESEMLLKGRYKTGKKLGENAVGETFDAVDSQTGTKVVVKQIKDEEVARTYEAVKACGKLDGIVDILDVFDEGGNCYAVMEFVAGMTIESYLAKSNAKFPVNRIKTLLKPIISSLIRLSEEGINHGNISADNFIFTNQGDLKLIGFGHIGGVVSPKSRPYATLEMYEKESKFSETSDVYAISTFIYRCITGIVPQDVLARKENDTCVRPLALGVEMSKEEDAALWMGMQVDNSKRLAKLAAFYRAFYSAGNQVQPKAPIQKTTPTPTPTPIQTPPPIQKPTPTPTPIQTPPPIQEPVYADTDKTEIINPVSNLPKSEPINTELNPNKYNKEKKQGNTLLIVLIIAGIIIVAILGFFTFKIATSDNGSDGISGFSFSGKSGENSEDETDEDDESDTEVKSLIADADEAVESAKSMLENDEQVLDGMSQIRSAMDQYLETSSEVGYSSVIEEHINDAYAAYVEGASKRADFMSAQTLSGSIYSQIISEIDDVIGYADTLSSAGYSVDTTTITEIKNNFDADYRKKIIESFNEFSTRDSWSRTESWNLMSETDSMFESDDLNNPIKLRYAFALAYWTQKQIETDLAAGTITEKGAATKIANVIEATDYNLMLIYEYINYMKLAGENCSSVESAYNDVINQINSTQGILIGRDVDVYHFWYFNNFDEYSSSVADGSVNGVTDENRDFIRKRFSLVQF